MRRAKYANFYSSQTRTEQRNSLAAVTITDIHAFPKPDCAKGASGMMRRGIPVRLMVSRGLGGDKVAAALLI